MCAVLEFSKCTEYSDTTHLKMYTANQKFGVVRCIF